MSFLPYGVAAWLFMIGLYGLASSENLIGMVICLAVLQSSTYVLLLAIGYRSHASAPIFAASTTFRAAAPSPTKSR